MLGETVGDIHRPGLALMRGVEALREDVREERDEEGKHKHTQKGFYNTATDAFARLISQMSETSSRRVHCRSHAEICCTPLHVESSIIYEILDTE